MKLVKLNCEDFMTNGLEFIVQSETETHYIGAPNYHIPKIACTVISDSTKEEPTPGPNLIAKAGEWVKIVECEDLEYKYDLEFNVPYFLKIDLHEGGRCELLLSSNTPCGNTFVSTKGMKFEKCDAPISEPVQEQPERISFDLDLYNTGKYDVVNRIFEEVRIICTDLYDNQPIVAYHKNSFKQFDINGTWNTGTENSYDLFLLPKTETVFVNLYRGECDYNSNSEAVSAAKNSNNGLKYYSTIEVKRQIK